MISSKPSTEGTRDIYLITRRPRFYRTDSVDDSHGEIHLTIISCIGP